jgi:hypothetical protein
MEVIEGSGFVNSEEERKRERDRSSREIKGIVEISPRLDRAFARQTSLRRSSMCELL